MSNITNKADLGKVAITVASAPWDANTKYEKLTQVFLDGDSYVSLKDNKNVNPSTDTTGTWAKSTAHGKSLYELLNEKGLYDGTEEEFIAEWDKRAEDTDKDLKDFDDLNKEFKKTETIVKNTVDNANTAIHEAGEATNLANSAASNADAATARANTAAANAEGIKTSLDNFIAQGGGATDAQVIKNTDNIATLGTNISELEERVDEISGKNYATADLVVHNLQNNEIGVVVVEGSLGTFYHGIYDCPENTEVAIHCVGGTDTARALAFLDADKKVIWTFDASQGGTADGTFVSPLGTKYVCVNSTTEDKESFTLVVKSVVAKRKDIIDMKSELDMLLELTRCPQIYQRPILKRDKNKQIKILVFGSSWFVCTYWYLPFILKSIGVNAEIHMCYIGGGSFAQWLNCYKNNLLFDNTSATDRTAKVSIDGGDWTNETINFADHVKSKKWDFIGFQQGAKVGVNWDHYKNTWSELVRMVGQISKGYTNIGYNATYTPPYWSEENMGDFPTSVEGQRMFQLQNNANIQRFMTISGIRDVSPCGATMWSMRRDTSLNNGLYDMAKDGMHPDNGLACYGLAMTFFETYFAPMYDIDIEDIDWIPTSSTQKVIVSAWDEFRAVSSADRLKVIDIIHQAMGDRFGLNG